MYPIQIRSVNHKQGKEDLPSCGYGCTSRPQDEDERNENNGKILGHHPGTEKIIENEC